MIHRLDTPPIDLATARDLAASLPHGRLEVVPGRSASLFFEHGEAMADLIADFVTGVERRRSAGPGPGADLTAREVEVLRLVAAGESNAEIAARLGVTINTVERHVVNVYRKIDARGRADATAFAIRNGLA